MCIRDRLRSLGKKPWRTCYPQPCRRPADGRYGENPNRMQHYYQFQVLIKPSPEDVYKRQGVDDALIKAGCKNGDEVRILGYAFDFEGIDDDEDYEDDVEFIEFDVDDEELATEDSQPEVGEEDPDVLA